MVPVASQSRTARVRQTGTAGAAAAATNDVFRGAASSAKASSSIRGEERRAQRASDFARFGRRSYEASGLHNERRKKGRVSHSCCPSFCQEPQTRHFGWRRRAAPSLWGGLFRWRRRGGVANTAGILKTVSWPHLGNGCTILADNAPLETRRMIGDPKPNTCAGCSCNSETTFVDRLV